VDSIVRQQTIPDGLLRHTVVLRQSPPAPVSFTASDITQTIFLYGIPAKHVVVGVVARLVTKFAAFGLSSCSVIVGGTSQVNNTITSTNFYLGNGSPSSFSCTQTVSPSSMMFWSPFAMYTTDPQDIKATFTSVGAQLATLTAGEIEFTIWYRPLGSN
jgi:hypothetical protein